MQVESLITSMTPALYERVKQLVETGKWFDGKPMSEHQRDMLLQAVLVYQAKVEQSGEHMTVGADGEIIHKSRQELKSELQMQQDSLIARFKKHDI
ncbi:DUF1315 family protein [Alteromonas sp. ASW11-36]|uniref:DUF1315 family protein n=1 Tax=Alteromonas arenosi TaxID=3055817 RepID=A0ABT7SWQ1_9ALTE|nr:DUF1315 family protein [Alteromonas sp. ASW11-36]MDM7860615.1 DUF1315 family protein [Alteromonas sp. ASW11-36]